MLQRTLFSLLSLRPDPVAGFGHMFSLSSYTTYRLLMPLLRDRAYTVISTFYA